MPNTYTRGDIVAALAYLTVIGLTLCISGLQLLMELNVRGLASLALGIFMFVYCYWCWGHAATKDRNNAKALHP